MDDYDKMLQNLSWNPSTSEEEENNKYVYIDSLTDICVKYFDFSDLIDKVTDSYIKWLHLPRCSS
jgi:hypothetical protein